MRNLCDLYLSDPSDYTRIYGLFVDDLFVDIYAHDDRQRFEFRVNGAVCGHLAYDAIRYDASEADFHEARYEMFLNRAYDARQRWKFGTGPVFVGA